MNNRLRLFIIGMGALLVAAVFTYPLWRPLFVRTVVNQGFPGLSPQEQTAFNLLSPTQQRAYHEAIPTDATMAVAMVRSALSPDIVVPTEAQGTVQPSDSVAVATGTFIEIDAIHMGSGTASILQMPDNTLLLRLEDFRVTNGPDLHVILTRNADPRTAKDVGNDYIELGALKGNVGNQSYPMPTETDLTQYKGVVIYSAPYHIVYSSAALKLS